MSNPQSLKIMFVNRSYWPDMEATGQLLTQLCDDLASDDRFDITVLCGRPNAVAEHQKNAIKDCRRNSGGRYELRNNVKIKRVRHTSFDKSSFIGRVINFVTFCCAAFVRLLFTKRVDLIVCETDPPIAVLFTCLAAGIRRTKMVCYLQDIYPDIAVQVGKLKEGWFTRLMRRLLVGCYRRCDGMIVLSQDMRNWLVEHGVSNDKIHEIHNWVDTKTVFPVKDQNRFRQENGLDDKFIVMYSGNMGQTQDFGTLLQAIDRLQDRNQIHFCFVGGGVKADWLREQVQKNNYQNVSFHPYQPRAFLAESLSAADLQLVMLSERMTQLMMPSKLYSALATATPVVAICDPASHLAEIVVTEHAGVCVREGDARSLADEVLRLYLSESEVHEMGTNAREIAVEKFDRPIAINHFRRLLPYFVLGETPQPPVVSVDVDSDLVKT